MADDGGGWTLVGKITPSSSQFYYDSTYWTTNSVLNETDTSLNSTDLKNNAWNFLSMNELFVVDVVNSNTRIKYDWAIATTLLSIISNNTQPTSYMITEDLPFNQCGSGDAISDAGTPGINLYNDPSYGGGRARIGSIGSYWPNHCRDNGKVRGVGVQATASGCYGNCTPCGGNCSDDSSTFSNSALVYVR